jgi:uncharacterized membrane protein (UPF0136 family)
MVSAKQKVAAGLAALYGIVAIAGGTVGFVLKGSIGSIVMGSVTGVLLVMCAAGTLYYRPVWCLLGSAIVSIVLLGFFLPQVVEYFNGTSAKLTPQAIGMSVGGLLVLFASAFALGTKGKC